MKNTNELVRLEKKWNTLSKKVIKTRDLDEMFRIQDQLMVLADRIITLRGEIK